MNKNSSKTIFFYIKTNFRERQWDTVNQSKRIFNVLLKKNSKQSESKIIYYNSRFLKSKIKNWLIANLPLINLKYLPPEAKNADFVYMWGGLPINYSKNKFIVEFDNPYCLTFYNYKAFKIYKKILSSFLDKAYKLTFMSETAKKHFLIEFNNKFSEKSFVIYPYTARNYVLKKNFNRRFKKSINFIFVAFNFREKGGYELIKAFNSVKDKRIKLYIYTSKLDEVVKLNIKDERIIMNPPINRQELINKVFPLMDILILPTFYESFPLVILEALSAGNGIITTNVYATPEMVINNKNGILLKHPILEPTKTRDFEFINNVKYRGEEFYKKFLRNNNLNETFIEEIKRAIEIGIDNYKIWQEESVKIYEEKFSEEIWFENLKRIFQ